jgi:hypothetical protein
VPDVVLSWILGAAPVEQFPHLVLDPHGIVSFFYDVILMENVTKEMAVIKFKATLLIDLRRLASCAWLATWPRY